jgi:hypothetical protein
MIKVGDLLVVQGMMPPAKVEKVWFDKETSRFVIELDWGDYGHSKVYDHDENKVWYKYTGSN